MKPAVQPRLLWQDSCSCRVFRVGPVGNPTLVLEPCKNHKEPKR